MDEYKRPEIVVELIYCACEHCERAQRELNRLCTRFGAVLNVTNVESYPPARNLSGWKTPIVFLNGRMLTTFATPVKTWEQAIRQKVADTEFTLSGEVISLECYEQFEDHGEKHVGCAKKSLERGAPVGLLTPQQVVFLLLADDDLRQRLNQLAATEVDVHGPVFRKGGLQSIVVRSIS